MALGARNLAQSGACGQHDRVSGCTVFRVSERVVVPAALPCGRVFPDPRSGRHLYRAESGRGGLGDDQTETTIRIQREEATRVPQPKSDPVIEQVQGILRDLNFYDGTVDGIAGPNTRSAIASYRKKVGLPASDRIDEDLLTQLGAAPTTAAIRAKPEPAPREPEGVAGQPDKSNALVMKIQAGLKEFGNEDIEVDGVIGARNKNAIREFQSLFGLPVTGEPDETLYAKMREIGLTD